LTELLRSKRALSRQHAAWLLGQVGRKRKPLPIDPIPSLIAALRDPSPRVRAEVIYAIGGFGRLAERALPDVEKIMEQEQGVDALWATRAAKEIDASKDIRPRLRELLRAGEADVRRNVAQLVPDNFPRDEARQLLIEEYERDTDGDTREILAQAMNKVGEPIR